MTENSKPAPNQAEDTDSRPTITIALPSGWARAGLVGIEAALLGWAVPVLLAVVALWLVSENPWVTETGWQEAIQIGSGFWALSVGAPATIGVIAITLIPLLWTLVQVAIVRALLLQVRTYSAVSVWAAVPFFTGVAAILLAAVSPATDIWPGVLGAFLVSTLASLWAVLAQSTEYPGWMDRVAWLWSGLRVGLWWAAALVGVALILVGAGYWTSREAIGAGFADLGATGLNAAVFVVVQLIFLPLIGAWTLAGTLGEWQGNTASLGLPLVDHLPSGAGGGYALLFAAVGIVLGLLSGWRLRALEFFDLLRRVAVAVVVLVVFVGIWLQLSQGSLGGKALASLGPGTPPVLGAMALLVILPAVALTLMCHPLFTQGLKRAWGYVALRIRADRTADAPAEATVVNPEVRAASPTATAPTEVIDIDLGSLKEADE